MIGIIPISMKHFDTKTLSVLKRIYSKIDLRFILYGVENCQEILSSMTAEEFQNTRRNILVINNPEFCMKEYLTYFVKYNEHHVMDDTKILLLEDNVLISTKKNQSQIENLKEDEILLIDIYKEINEDPRFNLLFFKGHKNIINAVYHIFSNKEKNNELILADVIPCLSFKYLKMVCESNEKKLDTKKDFVEYLINDLSLKIVQSSSPGIRLNSYSDDNTTTNHKKRSMKSTTSIQHIEDNSTEKQVITFLFYEIPPKYNTENMQKTWDLLFNLLTKSDKYCINVINNTTYKVYNCRGGEGGGSEQIIQDYTPNSKYLQNSILYVSFLNNSVLQYINKRENILLMGNNTSPYLEDTIFKKIVSNYYDKIELKMFQYVDHSNKIFTINTFNMRNDIIDLYQSIKTILKIL